MPVSFLFSSGITTPTALAAPVEDGMMFSRMPRPPRQSLLLGPSTVFCVAVAACTVVIRPRLMPHLSLSTLASGARQLVVQRGVGDDRLALVRLVVDAEDEHRRVVLAGRREDDLLRAGGQVLARAVSLSRNRPVDSITMSAPTSLHFRLAGSRSCVRRIFLPLTISVLPSTAIVALEAAVHRVVLQHVGQVVGLEQVVDADDLDVAESSALPSAARCGRCGRSR